MDFHTEGAQLGRSTANQLIRLVDKTTNEKEQQALSDGFWDEFTIYLAAHGIDVTAYEQQTNKPLV